MIYLRLFWEFFKTGLFSVGGGLATLPFIYDIVRPARAGSPISRSRTWSRCRSPRPAPSASTRRPMWATSRAAFPARSSRRSASSRPAVICILIIASCLKKFRENRFVDHAFYGLRPASAALIAAAGFSVVRISLLQESAFQASGRFTDLFFWKGLLLAAVIWVLTNVVKPTKKLHPIVYIAASAVVGIVFSFAGV